MTGQPSDTADPRALPLDEASNETRQSESVSLSGDENGPKLLFFAKLAPHKSLDQRGFLVLILALAVCSFSIGLLFFVLGAWPVVGFLGLDVALIAFAIRWNMSGPQEYQEIRVSRESVEIKFLKTQKEIGFETIQSYWVSVALQRPRGRASQVLLRSHGRSIEVGSFLSEPEKVELASALKAAIAQSRTDDFSSVSISE